MGGASPSAPPTVVLDVPADTSGTSTRDAIMKHQIAGRRDNETASTSPVRSREQTVSSPATRPPALICRWEHAPVPQDGTRLAAHWVLDPITPDARLERSTDGRVDAGARGHDHAA